MKGQDASGTPEPQPSHQVATRLAVRTSAFLIRTIHTESADAASQLSTTRLTFGAISLLVRALVKSVRRRL